MQRAEHLGVQAVGLVAAAQQDPIVRHPRGQRREVQALQPDLVIETGSAFGVTAELIGKALLNNGQGILHTIEPVADRADATRKRCEELPVVVEQMSSMDFVPPGPVGFAWFDSLMQLRVPEFRRYYPHLVDGAIVGFHDVGGEDSPLYAEICQLEAEGLLLPMRLRTPRGVCLAEVIKDV